MQAVNECEHYICEHVYSTSASKFSRPAAKSKSSSSEFFRSTQLSEFDLAILLQGQPNNEVLNKYSRDPQLCPKNEAYKKQICAGFSELSAFSTDKT